MKTFDHRFVNLGLAGALDARPATTALAAPAAQTAPPSFKAYDRNKDGTNPEEFQAQDGLEQAFREGGAHHDSRINAGKYVDDAWITAKVSTLH